MWMYTLLMLLITRELMRDIISLTQKMVDFRLSYNGELLLEDIYIAKQYILSFFCK